jgi:tRNA A-37 threonylcarbamoyl transferase component Bud32
MGNIQILNEDGGNELSALDWRVLPYRPVNLPLTYFTTTIGAIFLIIGAFASIGEFSGRVPPLEGLVHIGYFLIIGLPLVLIGMNSRSSNAITLLTSGIGFDHTWNYGLLDRPFREWTDVHSVDFNGRWKPSDILHWRLLGGCTVTIDFKSGGLAVLDLDAITRVDVERLFIAIEQHVGQSVLSKNALLFERTLMSVDTALPVTYETIWTDSLESQFGATNFAPLRTGSRLQSGMYEVRMQLASSGLSAVYLVAQTSGRKVVLKESALPEDTSAAARAKAKELFEREAKLLARMDHPQITKVLDHFVEDGREYIVLEFIPGMSLRQLVQLRGRRSPEKVAHWAIEIAEILRYLHSLDPPIVHRDLTPDNLILRSDGSIVLIDFGVSNEFVSRATGTLVGKQAYMPPEQIRGKAEPKSDVYAFGATLYFLITGVDPEPLTCLRPATIVPTLSGSFCDLITASTQLDCSSRPDASELIDCYRKIAIEQSK